MEKHSLRRGAPVVAGIFGVRFFERLLRLVLGHALLFQSPNYIGQEDGPRLARFTQLKGGISLGLPTRKA